MFFDGKAFSLKSIFWELEEGRKLYYLSNANELFHDQLFLTELSRLILWRKKINRSKWNQRCTGSRISENKTKIKTNYEQIAVNEIIMYDPSFNNNLSELAAITNWKMTTASRSKKTITGWWFHRNVTCKNIIKMLLNIIKICNRDFLNRTNSHWNHLCKTRWWILRHFWCHYRIYEQLPIRFLFADKLGDLIGELFLVLRATCGSESQLLRACSVFSCLQSIQILS